MDSIAVQTTLRSVAAFLQTLSKLTPNKTDDAIADGFASLVNNELLVNLLLQLLSVAKSNPNVTEQEAVHVVNAIQQLQLSQQP
jgi:hypothetical protein